MAAENAGQQMAWETARDNGLLGDDATRVWIVTDDERLCPVCEPMKDQERGLDEPFEDGNGDEVDQPPVHPQCRCTTALSDAGSGQLEDVG